MMRGTTPEHTFTLPVDTEVLSKVRVIYTQNDKRVLVKENCILSGNTVTARLTQAETFLFDHKKMVEIQLRVLTKGGDAINSEIVKVSVERCLDTEVIR